MIDHSATIDRPAAELDLNKILVVDDVKENLFLIEYLFRNSEFTLSLASSAKEALAKAQTELPILIISDIMMPEMSGFELLTALKADERTANIGVILVTAHHRSSKEVSQGLKLGADDYIYRPFVRDEFMSRVEAVLRLKRAEAETQRQARLLARRNKGLAWLNELALAVNSSLEVREIFSSSMQKLSQLLDAKAVCLLLFNRDRQELLLSLASPSGRRLSMPFEFTPLATGSEEVIQARVSAKVLEVLTSQQLYLGLPADLLELQVVQYTPMVSKEQSIGAILIVDQQRSIDEAEQVLLHSAAGLIAVAVENTRLLESAQALVDDLIALNDIGRALTSTLDLQQTLQQTTMLVRQSLQADATSLWLVNRADHMLELIAASGAGAEVVTGYRMPLHYGIAGFVAQTGDIYLSPDLSEDDKHYPEVAKISHYQPRSMLSIPVQVKNEIVGVMQALHHKPDWFDENDLRLAGPITSSVAIAVENARLFNEVQQFSHHLEQMVAARTRELAEEKEKTEAILSSIADGLLVLDGQNCILTANQVAEKMLGFRLPELTGQPIGPTQLHNPLWRAIRELAGGQELSMTALVDLPTSPTEPLMSIQAHSAKVRNDAGQIIGTVVTLRDLTALKEVERMKARFMTGVTHELKTPLSVIQLHTSNLQKYFDRLPAQKRAELLHSIQNQAEHLAQLIEDILALSRLDIGLTEAGRQVVELGGLIERISHDLRPLAEAKQIHLTWRKPAEAIATLANPDQLGQVIRNLVDNAIKYTPNGGSVQLQAGLTTTDDGQTYAKFQVSDTGIGIPPEQQSQVFDRFHRVDPAHTIPGTGLGLAIVKEVVNAYGGTVEVESTPGQGSTFSVALPVVKLAGG